MLSKKSVKSILSKYNELVERATTVADEVATIRGLRLRYLSGPEIEFDWDTVTAKWYDSYGRNDSVYATFPLEYLWKPDLVEAERLRVQEEAARKEREAADRKQQEEADAAIRRREQYERLRREFEPEFS